MSQMNFGEKWRNWIWGCLSSARVSVLVNGSAIKEFALERGIRQGGPLSPFLFILVAEGLNVALEEATSKGIFKGISLPNYGQTLTHLQYAYDVVFLGEWSSQNAKNLIRILRCYEISSGLKVNISQSNLFVLGVNNLELELLARNVQCSMDYLPFVYLGIPVGDTISRASYWSCLISKFQSKLSKWKASTLCFGGRLTLCKSVLGSLGTFLFSIYKAPVKVINTLEKLMRRFFWGGSAEKSKISWIAWEKVLSKQSYGRLNIGSLKAHNLALLGKWWWRFKENREDLWKNVIIAKYGRDGGFNAPSRAKKKSSY